MKVIAPETITTYICEEGCLHLEFEDDEGETISLVMDLETGMDVISGISDQIEDCLDDEEGDIEEDADAIGPCAGSA